MAADARQAYFPHLCGFFLEGVMQAFPRLGLDVFFVNLCFKLLRGNYAAIVQLPAHARPNASSQDRILSQRQVDAEHPIRRSDWEGHIAIGRKDQLPRCIGMMTCRKLSSPTGRMTPGAVSMVVSRATFGVLITSKTSRRKRTLKAIKSGGPSMEAVISVWFCPVSSDWPEISTMPGFNSPPGVMLIRAMREPSRAKISACLPALRNSSVESTVRVWQLRGMICSSSGKVPSISWETRSTSFIPQTTSPRP